MQHSMVGLQNDVGVITARERFEREIVNPMPWMFDLVLVNKQHSTKWLVELLWSHCTSAEVCSLFVYLALGNWGHDL